MGGVQRDGHRNPEKEEGGGEPRDGARYREGRKREKWGYHIHSQTNRKILSATTHANTR